AYASAQIRVFVNDLQDLIGQIPLYGRMIDAFVSFGAGKTERAQTQAIIAGVEAGAAGISVLGELGEAGTELVTGAGLSTAARTQQLSDEIAPAQQGRITLAVGLAEDAQGNSVVLISSSEGAYLRGVSLQRGEILVGGDNIHAEANIVWYAQDN